MLKHNLLTAYRNLIRNKVFSVINIGGMALGMAAFLFILQYIGVETGVNDFHKNSDRIFRVINQDKEGQAWPELEPGYARRFTENFSEIEEVCRFEDGIAAGVVQKESSNLSFREALISYVDGNFFSLFSFPLLSGSAKDLYQPNTVFISQSMSKKYFGNESPVDQTLILHNQFGKTPYTVKGVFRDMDHTSDIKMDMAFSMQTLANEANLNGNDWARLDNTDNQFAQTILLLKPNSNYKLLEEKLTAYRESVNTDDDGVSFVLQPLKNLHLAGPGMENLPTYGNVKYVYLLGCIALLIVLIAWFNYVNLSTANSLKKSVEVGVRKAIGADRGSLISQFLTQTALVNLLGLVLALILVVVLKPFFNQLLGYELPLFPQLKPIVWLAGAGVLILGASASGWYTAYLVSRFKTVETMKGAVKGGRKGVILRKGLVMLQFGVSAALMLATVVIYSQLNYLRQKDLGIDTDQMLIIRGPAVYGENFASRRNAFLDKLGSLSMVEKITVSGSVPGRFYNFRTSGFTHAGSKPDDKYKSYAFALIGSTYFQTYDVPLVAGRPFTTAETQVEWNDNSKVIINESALEYLGFENATEAILEGIQWDERHLDIIGVSADYHHLGVQSLIDPMIFYPQQNGQYYTVKLAKGNLNAQLAMLEKMYKDYFPSNPFDYSFVADDFAAKLSSERQYGLVFTSASVLAILIACLGLFGLTLFTVESRMKEIGLRKTLGAGVLSIAGLLSKDFLQPVLAALFVAIPVAGYFMKQWLAEFPYAVKLSIWPFLTVGFAALFIALITVSFQSIKGALTNPGKSLKSE